MVAFGSQVTKVDWSRFALPAIESGTSKWLQLDAAIEENHVARLIDQWVDTLDFGGLIKQYKYSGSPPLRPDLMLKMVLFCYHRGITSPAKWFHEAKENLVMQWLGQGVKPSRTIWYEFASRISSFLDQWNRELLEQAGRHGLLSDQGASLDGSTVAALASRHRLSTLDQVTKRLDLLEQAITADQNNEPLTSEPYWMGNTCSGRNAQQDRYRKAQRVLKKQHAQNELRIPSKRKPHDKIRVSVTDPQAPLGMDKHKVYRPLYNVQLLRDIGSPFILGYQTFARASDSGTLVPMIERGVWLSGILPKRLLVDSGYVTGLDLADASRESIDLYGPWKSNDYSKSRKSKKTHPRLSKDDFLFSEDQQAYRCPQGKLLTLRGTQIKKRSQGRTEAIGLYRADAKACQACALKPTCCPRTKSGRNLNRSQHEPLIEAHKKNGTARVEVALQTSRADSRIILRRCQGASQIP